MVAYPSHKKKVEEDFIVEPVTVLVNMIKYRLLVDLNFLKATKDLDYFEQVGVLIMSSVFWWLTFVIHLMILFSLIIKVGNRGAQSLSIDYSEWKC